MTLIGHRLKQVQLFKKYPGDMGFHAQDTSTYDLMFLFQEQHTKICTYLLLLNVDPLLITGADAGFLKRGFKLR